jgi:hypothetical protein
MQHNEPYRHRMYLLKLINSDSLSTGYVHTGDFTA